MEYTAICENDYEVFHKLANAYYREGEDKNTPQEEIDSFIRFLFEKVFHREISGYFVKDKCEYVGFALWAMDTENFIFSQIPGFGTILEIGLIPSCRASGHGKDFVSFLETCMRNGHAQQCYVTAYGPVQTFWAQCGYVKNGQKGSNGLPIMVKKIN